ncbi:MAG: class I SAM-dependent methyltransferase [Deltaproteobacteria bacterium]
MSDPVTEFYNVFAGEYAATFFNELDYKAFDRDILARFARLTGGKGIVCDVGCGPGHIGLFLSRQGARVIGIDMSAEMLEQAKIHCPGIEFQHGDMLNLSFPDNFMGGIVAFYAIVHLLPAKVSDALREFYRVLASGGYLLFSCHLGEEVIRVDKAGEERVVSVDYIFHDPDDLIARTQQVGFIIEEAVIRYPYKDVEYPSKRAYILARKD